MNDDAKHNADTGAGELRKPWLSQDSWDKAVIDVAYRRLDIEKCVCGYPRVKGWCCSFCGDQYA